MKRFSHIIAAGVLLLSSVPAFAQSNGNGNGNNDNNGNNSSRGGCTQTTTGGGGAVTGGTQGNRAGGTALLSGVIDAAVQDVQALNNIDAALSALNGSNVQVVCLNDTLNQNDVRILQDVLNGSPILSGDLNKEPEQQQRFEQPAAGKQCCAPEQRASSSGQPGYRPGVPAQAGVIGYFDPSVRPVCTPAGHRSLFCRILGAEPASIICPPATSNREFIQPENPWRFN